MPTRASLDSASRRARLLAARDAPLRGTDAVADRLHSAAIHLLRLLRRQDAELGAPVGPSGLSALSILVFGGPKTVGQLAHAEQVSLPTMSRLVASLERFGMVTRESDPADRRVVVVSATSVGRSVMRRGREGRVYELSKLLATLKPSEIGELGRAAELLERITSRG